LRRVEIVALLLAGMLVGFIASGLKAKWADRASRTKRKK